MDRRTVLALAAGLVSRAAFASTPIHASFPTSGKPIRIITLAVGGAPDIFSRLLGKELTKKLGCPVVVENKPGAGGNIAAEHVINAAPDGHTLLMSSPILAIGPYVMSSTIDPLKDLVPVAQVAATELVVLVNKGIKAQTLQELVALARSSPGRMNYAANIGSPVHLSTLLFLRKTGVGMTLIGYKGSPEGQLALARGEVDIMIDVLPSSLVNLGAKRVRALAVVSERRSKLLPDIPTAKEQGIDFVAGSWNALFAPAKTSPAVIDRISGAIEEVVRKPDFARQIEMVGATARYRGPRALGELFSHDVDAYRMVLREQSAAASGNR